MRRFTRNTWLLAGVAAGLLAAAIILQWPRAIFYCEGFGCLGLGIVYLMIAGGIIIVFAVGGWLFGPKPKFSSACFAAFVAFASLLFAFGLFNLYQKVQYQQQLEAYHAACLEQAELCE